MFSFELISNVFKEKLLTIFVTRALLVAGSEPRFLSNTNLIYDYFISSAGFSFSKITVLSAAKTPSRKILPKIEDFLFRRDSEPIVFVYSGHGLPGKICPSPSSSITYATLADSFLGVLGNFIFIDACCYAGSALPFFMDAYLIPQRGLFLGSTPANETANGRSFLEGLIDSYSRKKYFSKRMDLKQPKFSSVYSTPNVDNPLSFSSKKSSSKIKYPVRFGLALDYLLFSK